MEWRIEVNMNGVSIRCAAWKWLADQIRIAQHRDHAYGKPYLRGFFS